MAIALSILFGEACYYSAVSQLNCFRIGEKNDDNLLIPGLGYEVSVYSADNGLLLKVVDQHDTRSINAGFDESIVIDYERKIALFITKNRLAPLTVQIPADCVIHVGKSNAINSDGSRNEIVLDFPFVSRKHFIITQIDGSASIRDLDSTNGIFVNGKRIKSTKLCDGDVLSIFTIRITYFHDRLVFENVGNHLDVREIKETDKRKAAPLNPIFSGREKFSRAPRLLPAVEQENIVIEQPPKAGGTPQINWLNVLITPLVSVALMVLLVFVMGMSAVMLIMSGVMSVVSAVVAVITYSKQKKQHGETDEKIDEKYHAYLSDVEKRLKEAHAQQLHYMLTSNPSPKESSSIVDSRDRQLWERRPEDPDFLSVRLGTGTIPAAVTASFHQAQVVVDENKLESEASHLAEGSGTISGAPILCSFLEKKLTGIIGQRTDALHLVRNVITELTTTHSYDEVKIVALIPENEKEEWAWIRWLPHCVNNNNSRRYLYTSLKDAEESLDEIEEVLSQRKGSDNAYERTERGELLPYYLFIIAVPFWIEKHPIRKYIFSGDELGCCSLFVYNKLNTLPKECDQIVEVNAGNGLVFERTNSSRKTSFQMDPFTPEEADHFARSMAPIFTETEQYSASIPTSISFLEGYKVRRAEELNIAERWKKAKTYKSLSVPIAASAGGINFEFDIHEKRHGVNGIVAGMPGSGKTEMVQSWLLSLAVNYSPQDVSFVLIDFKGTGMIAPFRNLPHLAGSISNLDTNVDRNLVAIKSEVHRREAIIDKYSNLSIKNINDLNRGYAQGRVPVKLPVLLIVIDEFAEFKKSFPDFGAEVDSLTSKGRALGIFVILMTQKPAGVVSSKSEDNIKFRWCLRVANYSASREMLGKPDAAKINNPGRAFVKVGEDDVFEEVQSFWSGAPYDPDRGSEETTFVPISRVEWNGRRVSCEFEEKRKIVEDHGAEIDAVVHYIADFCRQNKIPDAEKVWTERLPEQLALTDILTSGFNGRTWPETNHTVPVIGLVDEPTNQRQYPMALDFSKLGHTVIYGAPVTGKTTLLQTLIVSLAMTKRPDEVSIYVMDFGGWNMGVLREFPHVGGIANDNEPEKLKKLVLLLEDILQERKEKFSSAGVGNISAYRDSNEERIPDVFLIVDNFGAMIKMYPDLDAFFISLTNSGANYGVYLVATATASNAVPMKISQNIKNALALQMIDKTDYTYIVGKVSGELPAILGRGYAKGNPPLVFQTALPTPGSDDKAISDNIKRLAKVMQEKWDGDLPESIPEMPERIPYGSIKSSGIPVGLSVEKVRPVVYEYARQHYLLISGVEQSEKSAMLQVIAMQLHQKIGGSLYVFNINGSDLNGLQKEAEKCLTSASDINAFVESMRPELQRRHAEKKRNTDAAFEPIIMAIDDYTVFFRAVSNETVQRLLATVKLGKGLGLYLIVAGDAYELSSFFMKGEALTLALGKARQSILLGGCLNDHGAVTVKASFSQKSVPVREHEGFFVTNTEFTTFREMEVKGGKE